MRTASIADAVAISVRLSAARAGTAMVSAEFRVDFDEVILFARRRLAMVLLRQSFGASN
jgi:hypothetical protein